MIFGLFTLLVAIIISAVSAFYSITGLTSIFPGAFWSIVIMGGALELGKITATVWLHKYWHKAGWQFKAYLIPAIIVLMIITSMGTFGYLSASHLSQSTAVDDISAQVSLFDEKIKTQKDNISTSKQALRQMDAQVDQMLGRTNDARGANRAVQIRRQQATERKLLQKEIEYAQNEITKLQSQREPLAAKNRVAESHIGPVKYIAALIYGDNPDVNLLERAVRWVIILLVMVFDPLALVLILAAEQTIVWSREDKKKPNTSPYPLAPTNPHKEPAADDEIQAVKDGIPANIAEGWHQEWVPDSEQWPPYELDDAPLTDYEIDEINRQANVTVSTTTSNLFFDREDEFFAHGKELARAIDSNNGKVPTQDFGADEFLESIDDAPANENTIEPKLVVEPIIEEVNRFDPPPINPLVRVVIDEDPVTVDRPANTSFGTEFPANPQKGDMFLRVDHLPNKTYKWNGQQWIETRTDHYAYDEEYIKHLINQIDSGNYNIDLLSEIEQEQIQRYLNEQSTK